MPSDWADTPYVRVYFTLRRDHPRIWTTPVLLGWYVRLLALAEGAYPAPAELPRGITDDVVAELVEDGVIELDDDAGYLFHGLEAERSDRRRRGVAGGQARAATADRIAGRFAGTVAGGESLVVAGDPIGDDDGDDVGSLVTVAGGVAGAVASTSVAGTSDRASDQLDTTRHDETRDDASSVVVSRRAETTPARAPVREVAAREEEWHGGVRPAAPQTIDCDDYHAHQTRHVNVAGVGWRCPVCESARAEAGPSFRDRLEAAGGSHF